MLQSILKKSHDTVFDCHLAIFSYPVSTLNSIVLFFFKDSKKTLFQFHPRMNIAEVKRKWKGVNVTALAYFVYMKSLSNHATL